MGLGMGDSLTSETASLWDAQDSSSSLSGKFHRTWGMSRILVLNSMAVSLMADQESSLLVFSA